MNADSSPAVVADVSVGVKTGVLLPLGIGAAVLGLLLMAGSGLLVWAALRDSGGTAAAGAAAAEGGPAGTGSTGPAGRPGSSGAAA